MLYFDFYGRLGNQLFQYAAMRNLSLLYNYDISYNKNFTWHGQKCLLDNFNIKPSSSKIKRKRKYEKRDSFKYYEDFLEIKDGTELRGHFVNEKYFYENRSIIKKELTLKDGEITEWGKIYVNDLKKDGKKIVGIHFRRGDDFEINNTFDENKVFDFINKVLEIIKKEEYILLFFIGGSRNSSNENDLNWLKENTNKFNNYEYIISPGSKENNCLKDYYLMSKCDIGIMPRFSSFSWWAFYVNDIENKKIFINKKETYASAQEFIIL